MINVDKPSINLLVKKIKDSAPWKDKYANELSSPDNLLPKLRCAAKLDEIGKEELCEIARTKSPRRAKKAENNTDECVRSVMRLAFDRKIVVDEEVRIQILCSLHGVKIPTASAILSRVFPEVWPVIDRRAWAALSKFELVSPKKASFSLTPGDWAHYMGMVNILSERTCWSPQQIDRWLYGYARQKGLGGTP